MKFPGAKGLRKGRISAPGRYYYLTKNTFLLGTRLLVEPKENACVLIERFFRALELHWWDLSAFVVMPDHFHLVIRLGKTKTLEQAMNETCRLASRRITGKPQKTRSIWQDGFHDHQIRLEEDLNDFILYTHMNPVKKGLVKKPEEWAFSSAHPLYRERLFL
ncbi:MAG: REP-associated tyrosine transposase [Planctomycetota bacterium]|jgi:REP element-mobilizing transposase RayT